MDFLQTLISIGGVALCALAIGQFALWSRQSIGLMVQNKNQFELSQELLRRQIEKQTARPTALDVATHKRWDGYRAFRVAKLIKETPTSTSVYLAPVNGKPIAEFQPGQHLTLRFQLPGESKPLIRCYSLSDRPNEDGYRITVKVVPPFDGNTGQPGRVSSYVNQSLAVDDQVEVKAPSGHFLLDLESDKPIVLLAGGIGITPLLSMANHLDALKVKRPVVLVYGVKNSTEHAFKRDLAELEYNNTNFHVINCYSHPTAEDVAAEDFQITGFASVDVLKRVLPDNDCQFYLCGPPPFMNSLQQGLTDWGVSETQIFSEAFGPASLGTSTGTSTSAGATSDTPTSVRLAKSELELSWDRSCISLLDLAETNEIDVDSGCRAGSCGTCETELIQGKVEYPDNQGVDCPPGKCLICIAKPQGSIELDL